MREYIQVSCGHCPECIAAKKESLLQRNYYEYLYVTQYCPAGFCFWSTLTFDNNHLPEKTFDDSLVSAFIKSLRNRLKYLGFNCEFKYFYVSELGETTQRPHYHIGFYVHGGVDFDTFERLVRECWSNGFTDTSYWHRQHILKDVAGIRYLIKYLNKQYGLENGDFIKTTFRCSKNLGYYPDFYDYTKDIVIPSAKGMQSHHIGQYFLNKKCYEYRTDADGNKLRSVNGSYLRCISEFGIDWKIDHLSDILESFEKSLYVKYQHLDADVKTKFDNLLAERPFSDFAEYCYLFYGRTLGKDAFQFDLSNKEDFIRSIFTMNRKLHHIGFFDNVPLDDTFEPRFKNFDLMYSLLYDIDFKVTADDAETEKQNSVNRLKKFINHV